MNRFVLNIIVIFIALAFTARAAVPPAWQSAYNDGQYRTAIALGEQDGSAEALVLAARAQLAIIDLGQSDNRKADAKAALKNAERAIKLDPGNGQAHLMKVAALGMLARGMSKMKSFRKGMAGKSKKQIEAALVLDPQSAWAKAMQGMWHLEIIRQGGKFGARVTGARAKKGAEACQIALYNPGVDAGIALQCGLGLLRLEGFENEAKAALEQAQNMPDNDIAFDDAMKARAREVLDIMKNDGIKAARQRAIIYLKYTAPDEPR